jgi:hypothetical protein
MTAQATTRSIYRVDKFIVPAAGREEFLARVRPTHELLGTMAGCLQNLVLEHVSGPGEFNIVTIVEWDGPAALENARTAIQALHEQQSLKPQEMFVRLGIKADMASYSACASA